MNTQISCTYSDKINLEFSEIFSLPKFKFLALEQPNAPDIPLVMTDWYHANADEIYTSNPFNDGGTDMQHGTTKHYCGNALKSYDHGVRVGFFRNINWRGPILSY